MMTKYKIVSTSRFKKDLKAIQKRGYSMQKIDKIVTALANGEALPPENRPHALIGEYSGCMECHIEPDWLLIYYYNDNEEVLVLTLTRTGTHSDLFR